MKYIYVKNYLNLSNEEKLRFYQYASFFVKLKENNQKIIFDENSLLISVDKNNIESFFDLINEINVSIINYVSETKDSLILFFDNDTVLKVKN